MLIYFSDKVHGSNFIKQHSETVMVWDYKNADCSLIKRFIVSFIIRFVAFVAVFLSVFSSVFSVHSLSVCLLYFMLAALVANKRIHNFRHTFVPYWRQQVMFISAPCSPWNASHHSDKRAYGVWRLIKCLELTVAKTTNLPRSAPRCLHGILTKWTPGAVLGQNIWESGPFPYLPSLPLPFPFPPLPLCPSDAR